jgi:hypothetical protein
MGAVGEQANHDRREDRQTRVPTRWVLAGRRCLGGGIWIGDEFLAPVERHSAQPQTMPGPREPS